MYTTHLQTRPTSLLPKKSGLPQSPMKVGRSPSNLLMQQRALGNQVVQRRHTPHIRTISPVNTVSGKHPIIQRDEETPPSSTTATSTPSPEVNVENVDGDKKPEVNSSLDSSPQLTQDLFRLDPRRFNIYLSPITPGPSTGPLAPVNPTSQFFPSIPSSLGSTSPSSPSVPSELSLFGAGPFHFRIVFEEPSLNISESLRESEQRFSQFINPPSQGIDTGKLIKGLITNFLTQTPPGKAILQGVTGAIGTNKRDESESGPTVNINLDVLPSPVLKGQPPSLMFGVQGSF